MQQTDEAIQFYSQKFKKIKQTQNKDAILLSLFLKQFEIGNNKQDKT